MKHFIKGPLNTHNSTHYSPHTQTHIHLHTYTLTHTHTHTHTPITLNRTNRKFLEWPKIFDESWGQSWCVCVCVWVCVCVCVCAYVFVGVCLKELNARILQKMKLTFSTKFKYMKKIFDSIYLQFEFKILLGTYRKNLIHYNIG